eukprot:scaffold30756_cov39-Cyclotella_meneghiniana.AAC.1
MQALEQIQEQLSPGNKMQIEQQLHRSIPRVQNTTIMQRLTEKATHSPPRVQFEEPKEPPRMIVASPRKQVVKSPQNEIVKPVPIIKKPKYIVEEEGSIAVARLKARKAAASPTSLINARKASATKVAAADDESIAERLLRRRREAKVLEKAFPVLDPETGQLLEYRQLLRHHKFKDAWSISAANEFG